MKTLVEAAGLPFTPLLPEADMGATEYFAKHPERQQETPGMEMFGFDMKHFFLAQLPRVSPRIKKCVFLITRRVQEGANVSIIAGA